MGKGVVEAKAVGGVLNRRSLRFTSRDKAKRTVLRLDENTVTNVCASYTYHVSGFVQGSDGLKWMEVE